MCRRDRCVHYVIPVVDETGALTDFTHVQWALFVVYMCIRDRQEDRFAYAVSSHQQIKPSGTGEESCVFAG